jgi:hypothetical protein
MIGIVRRANTGAVFFWALGAVALVVRLAPLVRSGSAWAMMNVDSSRYVELAKGLWFGCGFAQLINGHCGSTEVLRTPGYPLFLALMRGLRMAVAVQAVIGAALCVLIGFFVSAYWGLAAGSIAETLLALDIPSIVQGSRILSDVLFQALLAAAVILQLCVIARGLYDSRAVAVSVGGALLLAVAILVRPVGVLLPLLAPISFLILPRIRRRSRIALCLVMFAIPATVTVGWMARNAKGTGVWTLSTDVAIDLYYFKAGGVVWYRSHEDFIAVQGKLARNLGRMNASGYPDTPASLEPQMNSQSLQIFLHDPVATLIMTLRSLIWLALVPDRGSLNELLETNAGADSYLAASATLRARIRQLLRSPLLAALVALQEVLIVFTWFGVTRALVSIRGRPIREVALVLVPFCVALVMLIMAAGAEAYARYRMPAAPLLAILAGIGWSGGHFSSTRGAGMGRGEVIAEFERSAYASPRTWTEPRSARNE